MTAIRWVSGVLAALGRRGPTRSRLRGRIRFLEQARDGMRESIRSIGQERDGLRAQIASLQGPRQSHRQELIRIARQLRRWSDESHAGGWSTQQCEPMEALAKEIDGHIGEGVSYELMLRRVGRQLVKWADESLTGGWSTHQTKPMRALAAEIDAYIGAHCKDPSRSTLHDSRQVGGLDVVELMDIEMKAQELRELRRKHHWSVTGPR